MGGKGCGMTAGLVGTRATHGPQFTAVFGVTSEANRRWVCCRSTVGGSVLMVRVATPSVTLSRATSPVASPQGRIARLQARLLQSARFPSPARGG